MTGDQLFIVAILAIVVPGLFSVLSTVLVLILNKRLRDYKEEVNHRMDQLITSKEGVARGEGRVEGIASEKKEASERNMS